MKRLFLTVILMLLPLSALAGKDPIGWSQSGTVPGTTELDQVYSVSFTLINNLPFTMPTPLKISNNSTPTSEVTMIDDCSGKKLAPQATCDVGLLLIPRVAGTQQLSVYMEYGKNKVQIPKTPIRSQTLAGSLSQLQGKVTNKLPSAIRSNSTYTLTFTFSNIGSTALTGFSFAPKSNNSAGYTQTSTTNCGTSLPVGGPNCVITGTFTTSATSGAVSVGYTGTAGSFSASPTTSSVINNNTGTGTRQFTFVNDCPQPVWFFMGGGGQGNLWGCTSDASCDALSGVQGAFACDPTAHNSQTGQNGECFWRSPVPTDGNYELAKNGGRTTVSLTEYVYTFTPAPTPTNPNPGSVTAVWSGNIAGRTGCTAGGCETADCNGGTGACPVGTGFNQPATQLEMTLEPSQDSYDLTGINGFNVPMSMAPTNATPSTTNPYTCGSPGITTDQTASGQTIGGCGWAFTPPTGAGYNATNYVWVKNNSGATQCTAHTTCDQAHGEACGLSIDNIGTSSSQPANNNTYCGKWLGYWTADEVCGINSGYSFAPYTCNATADGGSKFSQMYACGGSVYGNSCYTSANQTACCGCQNWQDSIAPYLITLPTDNSIVQQCGGTTGTEGNKSTNTTWINNALPTLTWYKAACPSNYVYPFDDKSSSYTCSNSSTSNNVNYTVTFCPGGNSGAPTGTIVS